MIDIPDQALAPAQLRRVPPNLAKTLVRRGEWSYCAMEHSRIGAIAFESPAVPFHHLALPLEQRPLRFGLHVDGRRRFGRNAPNMLTVIAAGAAGSTSWDGDYEAACCYFTDAALGAAMGTEIRDNTHPVRSDVALHAPRLVRLLRALHRDAVARQPHGTLVGDAIFVALAAELVSAHGCRTLGQQTPSEPWRVRSALEHIHACLTERLSIDAIAAAAATSPFYLNHLFRATLGVSIWRYVVRERARYAIDLMRDPSLNLSSVAQAAGFESYAGFITAVREQCGQTPGRLRARMVPN